MKKIKIMIAVVVIAVAVYSALAFFEVVPFYPKGMTILIVFVVIDCIVEYVRMKK